MGSSKSSNPAPPKSQAEIAEENVKAQIKYAPQAAQAEYDIFTNPTYGAEAWTRAQEEIRRNLFPNESAVKDAYVSAVGDRLGGTDQEYMQNLQNIRSEYFPEQQALLNQLQNVVNRGLGDDAMSNMLSDVSAYQQGRAELYPQEQQLQDQLFNSILANLQSPTGLTAEQQAAVDQIRQDQTDKYKRDVRTRANLGGGLFGGNAIEQEFGGLQDLRNQFAEEDIDRNIALRQQAIQNAIPFLNQVRGYGTEDINTVQSQKMANIQAALPVLQSLMGISEADISRMNANELNSLNAVLPMLQVLYPSVNITSPQYTNPVPSANTALSADTSRYSTDAQIAAQQQQANQALQSALFQALGSAAGGLAGGIGQAGGLANFFKTS